MDDPDDLRAKAEHYRELAQYVTDARAQAGIKQLAEQYEARAIEREADASPCGSAPNPAPRLSDC
jgi:hypothetical protein